MATGTFWQRGEAIDYTNASGSKIEANEIVILGSRIGIAGTEMANGETGSLHVFGVFELPKKASEAISAGVDVYWNGTGITASADDGGNPATPYAKAGYAIQAAVADDTTIKVKLLG